MAIAPAGPVRARLPFDEWLTRLSRCRTILDLGSGDPESHPAWFGWPSAETRIVRLDVQARLRPDVVADADYLPLRSGSVDGILAVSLLEHVPRPWLAVQEMLRVLRAGGLVVGYVPYMWPYHADHTFHDYFRFSDEAIAELFSAFTECRVHPMGGYTRTMLRFLAGFTSSERHLLRFEPLLSRFLHRFLRNAEREYPTRFGGLRRSATGFQFLAVK